MAVRSGAEVGVKKKQVIYHTLSKLSRGGKINWRIQLYVVIVITT